MGTAGLFEKFMSWRLCGYLNEVLWLLEQFSDSGEKFRGVGISDRPEYDRCCRPKTAGEFRIEN